MASPDVPTSADVCIVGAGAAGGIMAAELARRGVRVVVLEAGSRHELTQRSESTKRFLLGQNPFPTSVPGIDGYTNGGSVTYRLEGNRARGVGGSTLHWEGYTLRLHPNDFRLRSLYGIADDWPLAYEDLEAYYTRAERALGVAGAADDPWASPRRADFPLPPFPFSHSDGFFRRACQAVNIALHHMPQARNSVPFGGRAPCRACGTCHVCPIGAKASIDLTHIALAEATGRAVIVPDVTALRLEVDQTDRVRSVVFAGADRRPRTLAARVFVLAGGGVETPRLLLLSKSARFPYGLANRGGMVGTHFMTHPIVRVMGQVKERVLPYRTGFSSAMSRQFAIDRDRATRGAFFVEFLNSAGPKPHQLATASFKWGEALRAHVKETFGHRLGIRIFCEQLPDARNAVGLDPALKDYFGNPVPRISYNVGTYARAALDEGRDVAVRILRAAGATDITATPPGHAAHQIGTHRMGRDPRTSVVDADLRAHDVPNLYLVGAGTFVTASASPPTLTIAALAIRAAEHLVTRLRGEA